MSDPVDWHKPEFTRDEMHSAMCIIEELIDPVAGPSSSKPWQEFRDMNGINELRCVAIDLVRPCMADWNTACHAFEQVEPTLHPEKDPGSFDYDFVPFWLRNALDWPTNGEPPIIRGQRHKTTVSDAPDNREPSDGI